MKCIAAAVVLAFVAAGPAWADEFRVTVVSVLASDRHTNIDAKLAALAEEVRKRDQSLTGFRIERSTVETIPAQQKKAFPLVGDLTTDVTVVSFDAKEKKVKVTIKGPTTGDITYTTVPDKFFPVLTRHQTEKEKERLVFAVMVRPVPAKD